MSLMEKMGNDSKGGLKSHEIQLLQVVKGFEEFSLMEYTFFFFEIIYF